jgi:hypothetical protein
MPRRAGHDGRKSALVEHLENAKAHLVRATFDLELVQLRTAQAITRARHVEGVLDPVSETLTDLQNRLRGYQSEIDSAIKLVTESQD